ncbi:enoyl-CoA hydratase/isomerase family protein [Mycobacterium sp. PDNC021]|uniref:enoyl-CoA hydratase/isomerase family protein n=1 Tax=Mycobacterium sp. PDNC021 TaxID=3391399 RepID=UPI003AB08FDB
MNTKADARLLSDRRGRVLTLRFNNPPHHHYDEQMSVELDQLTRQLKRDRSIGAVIFTGQDGAYTHLNIPDLLQGARLTPFGVRYLPAKILTGVTTMAGRSQWLDGRLRDTRMRGGMLLPRTYAALDRMNRMDKVFIAAINGTALAFGCVFALACDIRLMAAGDHVIGLPESAVAMLGAAGGTQRLVRAVGASRAVEMLLEGRYLTPDESARIGLVHRVVAKDRLDAEAMTIAERLAQRPPLINREIKRLVYDAGSRSLSAGLRMEAASLVTAVSAPHAPRHAPRATSKRCSVNSIPCCPPSRRCAMRGTSSSVRRRPSLACRAQGENQCLTRSCSLRSSPISGKTHHQNDSLKSFTTMWS